MRLVAALMVCAVLAASVATGSPAMSTPQPAGHETTVADIRAGIAAGAFTCEEVVEEHLARIYHHDLDPLSGGAPLGSVLSLNPHALQIARDLDDHYASSGFKGPLHCAPLLLKDNYDTFDHPTTAASLSMLGSQPPDDAFSVARLREAGAVVLGKTNMTEFAYYTSSFNSRTVRIGSSYDSTKDAGGSSGGTGSAIAAGFAVLGTGSDTCASIRLPSSNHSLVGIRSSVGLVSQDGLVPLSSSQDVPGPMTRTVRDAVLMLDAMAGQDAADPKTQAPIPRPQSYLPFLKPDGLTGKKIGVLRSYGSTNAFGSNADIARVMDEAIDTMRGAGAVVVDPVTLPDFQTISVIVQEFQTDIDRYLASFDAPRGNLLEVIASGRVHPFIQALLVLSVAINDTESPSYFKKLADREDARVLVEAEMDRLGLDALVFPPVTAPANNGGTQGSNCAFGSTTTGPSIVVPAGFTQDDPALPVGIEIYGRKWDEGRLIEIAYAFEQASLHRRPPVLGEPAPVAPSDLLPAGAIQAFNAHKRRALEAYHAAAARNPEAVPAEAYLAAVRALAGI